MLGQCGSLARLDLRGNSIGDEGMELLEATDIEATFLMKIRSGLRTRTRRKFNDKTPEKRTHPPTDPRPTVSSSVVCNSTIRFGLLALAFHTRHLLISLAVVAFLRQATIPRLQDRALSLPIVVQTNLKLTRHPSLHF